MGKGRVSGWRTQLIASADLNELFAVGERALASLMEFCPEIRHVLHLDLLSRNVLVSPDGSRLEVVFDWGWSVFGDFLYDVACITFWAPWYSALDSVNFREVIVRHYESIGLEVPNFEERLTCYELHIGLVHLAYCTFTGRSDDCGEIAKRLVSVLEVAAKGDRTNNY
jgi:hygromycin-B 4-O-kinase